MNKENICDIKNGKFYVTIKGHKKTKTSLNDYLKDLAKNTQDVKENIDSDSSPASAQKDDMKKSDGQEK